jgi:hypothetical protein
MKCMAGAVNFVRAALYRGGGGNTPLVIVWQVRCKCVLVCQCACV